MSERAFVGIDVNRNGIQAVVRPTGEKWATGIDDSGINEIAERLSAVHPDVIVMEAHGGLELPVAGTLATVGFPLALVSPRSVRDFARAVGRNRGGRDHAALLAHFAELVRPETPTVPESLVEHLRALKTRRETVLEMLAQERRRMDTEFVAVHRDVRNHIFFLERSAFSLNEEINRMVKTSSMWR
jgi:transposase